MKKKAITTLVTIGLIVVILGGLVGSKLYDKYSYSKERADLDAFFGLEDEDTRALVLNEEMVPEKVLVNEGSFYLDLDTVYNYINKNFYVDENEQLIIYTTATESVKASIGEKVYGGKFTNGELNGKVAFLENEKYYLNLEFVQMFSNLKYEVYEKHVHCQTVFGEKTKAAITKDTAVRCKGGVKSPILRELEAGEEVVVLEEMENWSKIMTDDAFIGCVENKRLSESFIKEEINPDYVEEEYESNTEDRLICLGFHAIGGIKGNATLKNTIANTKGLNVIAPTWFSLNDNEGGYRSFGESWYVDEAHGKGLEVWGVLDDFNYRNETRSAIDDYTVLSRTSVREKLENNIVAEAKRIGLDGINLDFEKIDATSGPHFVQFLRELSILCRENDIVLSADNYPPFNFNAFYRLDVQGKVLDYVIMMGYDEHYHGSNDPGSVASLEYVNGGLERTIEQVPANKVINALPLYTILWKINGTDVKDEYITFNNTDDFLVNNGFKKSGTANSEITGIVWDEQANQNYLEWEKGGATYKIWLEDVKSLQAKINVMMAKEIGGAAVWRLGYDNAAVWNILGTYLGM